MLVSPCREPQEFVDDAAQVELLGGRAQESLPTGRTASGGQTGPSVPVPVRSGTLLPLIEELLQQVEILTHEPKVAREADRFSSMCVNCGNVVA